MLEELLKELDKIKNYNKNVYKTRNDYNDFNDFFMNLILINNINYPYKIDEPILTDGGINIINKIINNGDYPKELKPLVDKLYTFIGPENLYLCAMNLLTIKIIKDKKYKLKKFDFSYSFCEGKYYPDVNQIYFYNKNVLSHELLHMASTCRNKNNEDFYFSGFRFDHKYKIFQRGLNEGYTELLDRRVYYNEDYNTDSLYKINVFILRMFELLYPNYKYMERDYFWANRLSPLIIFRRYGSVEEYFKLSRYLDFFANTKIIGNEDIEMLNFINKIIKRTYDNEKIIKAEKITEEYLEIENKKDFKTFSLYKKRH